MSKAKVKVSVKSGKPSNGSLVARVPMTVARNDNPSGKKMYETKAKVLVSVKSTRGGKPRARSR